MHRNTIHCLFQCNQPQYIVYLCFLVFLHSSVDSLKEVDKTIQSKTTFFNVTHFQTVEMIALTLLNLL